MIRSAKRRKNIQKNRFKITFIALAIAICLFVIYKFNFTTKSEIEITTPVKFKEFESENELLSNIPLLEDEHGKYIILPEKVNGIFTKAYYLSDGKIIETPDTTDTNTVSNTTTDNTNLANTSSTVENVTNENVTAENVTNTIQNTTNENAVQTNNEVKNESIVTNTVENNVEKEDDTKKTENQETPETSAIQTQENQIEALTANESLFSKATKTSEEYADKLEEIAGTAPSDNEKDNSSEENAQESVKEETPEQTEPEVVAPQEPASVVENTETNIEQNPEPTPSEGNKVVTEKLETLPGEKYYLSEAEIENENLEFTVAFQTVEINGVKLYNQELTKDMINAVIKLTCYTPYGYYLDVKEEDINTIQELKADVEELSNSETVLAYDIKIVNGENEFQPEDYYQVATVSITKPETIDFKTNSHSIQLLHIKESDEELRFEKMEMSKIESDGFEFATNEFSTYAVILYAADQGDSVTINDYESDRNYYLGKNYTDGMAGKNLGKYTDENLAQVNINYYSYDPDINLSVTEQFNTNNCGWNFDNNRTPDNNGSIYNVTTKIQNQANTYIDINKTWSMEFIVPTNLRDTFENSFSIAQTNSRNSNITFAYDTNTYKLIVSGQNMNMWTSTGANHAVGPFELSFKLYFNGNVSINSFVPVSQNFVGSKKILVGTTSNAENEQHVLYSYVKCLPIKDNKVDVELIDNPFMDRPAGFGFNGWVTKEANTTISLDNATFVQTLQRTLTAEELASKQVAINVYVDWKEASIIFVNTVSGSDYNNGLTIDTAVRSWTGVRNRLDHKTATNASNRELNIVVLINGTLNDFSNDPECAYTLTSLYNGVDYRNVAQVNITTSITANYDRQIDFIKTDSASRYQANQGTSTLDGNLTGNAKNLRIGRGMYASDGTNYTTISQILGTSSETRNNYRTVIESGYYNNIQVIATDSSGWYGSTVYTCATLVLGSDIDRVTNNNNNLKVNYRVASTAFDSNVYSNDENKPATNIIVKSGNFGYDGFEYYYNIGNDDYAYAGIYVGGHGSSYGSFYGDRGIVVEGGRICNIIGGLKLQTGSDTEKLPKTYIYVKNGEIRNIVGGAGVSPTRGDRIIQVTGGTVEYGVSGGSNGFVATSSNNAELIGNTLVYVGGNAVIGSETAELDELYGLVPGTVCGAGNGRNGVDVSGKVYTSHVIIDGDATINNSVYGGGNYGYVQDGNTSGNNSPFEETALVNGGKYIIANQNSSNGSAIHYNNGSINIASLANDIGNEYYWTIELTGTNTFYIKYENNYLRAPSRYSSADFSFTTDRNNATLFTYSANRRIYYNRTYYLRIRNTWSGIELQSTRNNTASEFYFLKEKEPDPDENKVEVDTIDILGGTVKNNVYGGSNRNKIVGNVDINMLGGTIEGTIFGGSNTSGNIEGNVDISIEGGNIGTQVSQDSIFGGGYGSGTTINKNVNISIKDTADNINILGSVYGGGSLGNITGTTEIKVEDHYSDTNTISIQGNIFGGGRGQLGGTSPRSSENVTVNVDGGNYENLDVYGGYNENGTVRAAIAVNIGQNYETKVNDVYGGGNHANITNTTPSTIVKMYEHANVNNAYNGGNSAGIAGDTTVREIHSIGAIINNLFGGANVTGDINFTNVYVSNNSKIGNVFGGGNQARIVRTTNVNIEDSTITENVYGGGNQATVDSYTTVNISSSNIKNVYGGGNAGAVRASTGNATNVNISKQSTIENSVYGGGCSAAISSNSSIIIENSTIKNVYGGGEGENATVFGNTDVLLNGIEVEGETPKVTIQENVYGGGDLGIVNGDSIVTILKTDVNNSVFGGGNKANINGKATVTIQESTSKNVYGGGMNGAVGKTTAVTITDETTITNNVFGGGSKGNVTGNTVVNIDNSKVLNDVFGGGEAAQVNATTVSLTNNSEANNVYGGGDNGVTASNTNVALRSVTIHQSAFGAGNGVPAIVKGKSYIYADGNTSIGASLFAGGNNSSTGTTDTNPNRDLENKTLEKATAVADIAGATIKENVYGGANTSVIYGDTVVNIGTEAIKSYYESISSGVIPNYTKSKISIGGTIYGGGEQMDPNKEYNYDTVSVEGYIKINIDGTGYDTGDDNTISITGSIFGSGHASRAGLPTSYITDTTEDSEQTAGYVTINGDVNVKNYGSVKSPKSMVSIQRCSNVILDKSALWMSGATDSTNTHSTTYFSFNHIDALKIKNDTTLYLRATSNLLKSFYSVVDVRGREEKAKVEIVNEISGADGNTYDAIGNYIYNATGTIKYVIKSGQIFTVDKDGNAMELVTDVVGSRTKSVTKNTDNRIYMYSGLNLNVSTDENLGDDTWGPVEGMTFFGIFNTTNTEIDKDEDTDISQTTDTNNDFSTIHTGMYDINYEVSDTELLKWEDRNYNRCYVEGKHVKSPQEQDIQVDGFYTNYEKFGVEYGDDEEIEESTFTAHNPTTYTDYITPTPDETNYYMWYAGPDQDFYYYDLALIASKLSTYGTLEKTLQGMSVSNATFKITSVESSLINGAVLYNKNQISNINTTGNPNREFALAMKTGTTGWNMNGETNFVTSPNVDYTGTNTYKTENSSTTPSLGFYLYHSNNISEEAELGYFTINMVVYYWKTPTQQAKARVTIDVAIGTKVYEDLGYDASITPGRQYELFPRTTTNVTTKSSFSAYFQLHEKDFLNNKNLMSFFSHKEYIEATETEPEKEIDVPDMELIQEFIDTNYRLIKTDYVFPEDTTITMIDKSTDNPTYYYYTVTADDVTNSKKQYRLSEFRKMGSVSETMSPDTAEYYLDSNRSSYVTTVNENGTDVTYQSETFIFIVDFESAKFNNIEDIYEIVKNQAFHLILTSNVKNVEGEALEISILEEYKESNSISFGIYNTESTIQIDATISPNKIYVGDSTDISIETNYITEKKDESDVTTVYDTRYFDSKLGVKITIFDEAGDVVHGANLLGAYFKITEADGSTAQYYPRTDGTTRMKIADKVSNSKATITFETEKSTLPTGRYRFLIESFGSADGVYFGVESSDSTELYLNVVNDEFGLESEIPTNYVIIDKETGYTLEDATGFTVEKEYEILDENGNVVGKTTEELNDGKNDFEYSVKYSSGYENPYIAVALYRRNYNDVYDKTYSLVNLMDYLDISLNPVPDNIKDQFAIQAYDEAGNEKDEKLYVGYEAYGIDFINKAVEDATTGDGTRPVINLITKCSLKDKLVSGTYKLVFTLYDKSEVEKLVETENEDGTITAELQTVIEYQRIGETYSYMIIK